MLDKYTLKKVYFNIEANIINMSAVRYITLSKYYHRSCYRKDKRRLNNTHNFVKEILKLCS